MSSIFYLKKSNTTTIPKLMKLTSRRSWIVALVVAGFVSASQFAEANPIAQQLVFVHSKRCLVVKNGSQAKGTQVYQSNCRKDDKHQRWTFVYKEGGYGLLKVAHSGQCLDVVNNKTANGTLVQQWNCHGTANQLWALEGVQGQFGTIDWRLRSKESNKCLYVKNSSNADNADVVISDCTYAASSVEIRNPATY